MPERALSEVHDAMSDDLKVLHAALHDVGTGAAGLADATLTAEVSIGVTPGGGFGLAVMLDLDPGADEPGCAAELMRAAHAMCPYPPTMPGNIDVALPVRGQSLVEA